MLSRTTLLDSEIPIIFIPAILVCLYAFVHHFHTLPARHHRSDADQTSPRRLDRPFNHQ